VEEGPAATPGRRRTRIILIGSLVFVAVVVAVGLLYVRPKVQDLHRKLSDAELCGNAMSSLQLSPPFTGTVVPGTEVRVPAYEFHISRTTASAVAAELSRANASQHPWDQEPRATPVVRCQSGNVVWVADRNGHAARVPGG
jgi:hypothetical protein